VRDIERAIERVASHSPVSPMSGPDGRIDFQHRQSLYRAGDSWKLVAPGLMYVGEPGDWELAELAQLSIEDPFWLLDVLETTTDAEAAGREAVAGVECDRYDGHADFESAARLSNFDLMRPSRSAERDLTRLSASVWIDTGDLVRRARLSYYKRTTQIEMSAFGQDGAIVLPDASEVQSE
jgi:hypothetical protein